MGSLSLPLRNRLAELVLHAFEPGEARATLSALARASGVDGCTVDTADAGRLLGLGWFESAGCGRVRLLDAHRAYGTTLAERSGRAASVVRDWRDRGVGEMLPLLDRAAALANHGLFFEVHELLEPAWFHAAEPERTALQGLIQVAVAFHHLENGNRAGACSLLVLGVEKVAGAGAALPLDTPGWLDELRAMLATLAAGGWPAMIAHWPHPASPLRSRDRMRGGPMALLLNESEVTMLLPMSLALEAVEEVFRWQGEGKLTNKPRVRLSVPGGLLHVMPAALPEARVMGLKTYATVRSGAKFVVLLFSAETGALLAIIEADKLGQTRTGAASGVATKHLARPDADRVGCYGTGWQARSQLEAVCAVRRVREVRVYGRDPERRARFAEEMASFLRVPVVAVDRPEAAARDASILVTITGSKTPVLEGRWIAPGAHVNAAGSNALQRAELDVEAVRRAGLIVTDSLEQARVECGDLVAALEQGVIRWDDVHELGEVVAGRHPGRTGADQITLFESQGVAMEDIAVAVRLVARARERSVGTEIPI